MTVSYVSCPWKRWQWGGRKPSLFVGNLTSLLHILRELNGKAVKFIRWTDGIHSEILLFSCITDIAMWCHSYSCEQSKTKQNKAIKKKTLRITLTINIPDFEEESFRFSVSFKDWLKWMKRRITFFSGMPEGWVWGPKGGSHRTSQEDPWLWAG